MNLKRSRGQAKSQAPRKEEALAALVREEFAQFSSAMSEAQDDSDRLTFRNVFVPLKLQDESGDFALTQLGLTHLYSLALSPGRLAMKLAGTDLAGRKSLLASLSSHFQETLDAIADRKDALLAETAEPAGADADAVKSDDAEPAEGRAPRAFGLDIPKKPDEAVASLQRLDATLSRIYESSQVDRATVNALTSGLAGARMALPVGILGGGQALVDVPTGWWSDVGTMFLDRTRERPQGVTIGEEVYFLPLSPGEEVISEQRAFTKRQIAYEDMNEEEAQKEMEFSSTLSTELQEGLQRENSKSSSSGFTAGGQIGVGPPVANLGLNVGVSNNTAEADNATRSHSTKSAFQSTSRLAAKYRGLHRITFKISTESGFESTSKRVQRNPARFTSNTLACFKIMRKVALRQERYGVRLCWAPTVRDPGWGLRDRIRKGRERITKDIWATVVVPPKPPAPTRADVPAQTVRSAPKKITRWDIGGGTDITEEISIQAPAGLVWDRDAAFVKSGLGFITGMRRNREIIPLEEPRFEGDTVKILVRVKVDARTIQNTYIESDPASEWTDVFIEGRANFVPDPAAGSAAFQKEWDDYVVKLNTWQADLSTLEQRTRARIAAAADTWERELRNATSDLSELTSSLVGSLLPAGLRDEPQEVDLWRELFDWSSVSYELVPGWWNGAQLNYPLEPAESIVNASWARIYLPVSVGAEDSALKWLYGTRLTDKAREGVVKDIQEYRTKHFGKEELQTHDEKCGPRIDARSIHLGSWPELLPTDGTHIEILRGSTTAAGAWELDERDAAESRALSVNKLLASAERSSPRVNIDVDHGT